MQNLHPLNTNLYRDYPFKYKKVLPIIDITLQVPTETEFVYISKVDEKYIYFNDFAWGSSAATPYVPEVILDALGNTIGRFMVSESVVFPLQFTQDQSELEDCVYFKSLNNTINSLTINGVKAKSNVIFTGNDNLRLTNDSGTLTFDSFTEPTVTNYLVSLNRITRGKFNNISGQNIINVTGNIFSTTIDDPQLLCPTSFEPGTEGLPGEQGDPGSNGADGEFSFDYFFYPEVCDKECNCYTDIQTQVCLNSFDNYLINDDPECTITPIVCEYDDLCVESDEDNCQIDDTCNWGDACAQDDLPCDQDDLPCDQDDLEVPICQEHDDVSCIPCDDWDQASDCIGCDQGDCGGCDSAECGGCDLFDCGVCDEGDCGGCDSCDLGDSPPDCTVNTSECVLDLAITEAELITNIPDDWGSEQPKLEDGKFDYSYWDYDLGHMFLALYLPGLWMPNPDSEYLIKFGNITLEDDSTLSFYAMACTPSVKGRPIDVDTLYFLKPSKNCDNPFYFYCDTTGKSLTFYSTWKVNEGVPLEKEVYALWEDGTKKRVNIPGSVTSSRCSAIRIFDLGYDGENNHTWSLTHIDDIGGKQAWKRETDAHNYEKVYWDGGKWLFEIHWRVLVEGGDPIDYMHKFSSSHGDILPEGPFERKKFYPYKYGFSYSYIFYTDFEYEYSISGWTCQVFDLTLKKKSAEVPYKQSTVFDHPSFVDYKGKDPCYLRGEEFGLICGGYTCNFIIDNSIPDYPVTHHHQFIYPCEGPGNSLIPEDSSFEVYDAVQTTSYWHELDKADPVGTLMEFAPTLINPNIAFWEKLKTEEIVQIDEANRPDKSIDIQSVNTGYIPSGGVFLKAVEDLGGVEITRYHRCYLHALPYDSTHGKLFIMVHLQRCERKKWNEDTDLYEYYHGWTGYIEDPSLPESTKFITVQQNYLVYSSYFNLGTGLYEVPSYITVGKEVGTAMVWNSDNLYLNDEEKFTEVNKVTVVDPYTTPPTSCKGYVQINEHVPGTFTPVELIDTLLEVTFNYPAGAYNDVWSEGLYDDGSTPANDRGKIIQYRQTDPPYYSPGLLTPFIRNGYEAYNWNCWQVIASIYVDVISLDHTYKKNDVTLTESIPANEYLTFCITFSDPVLDPLLIDQRPWGGLNYHPRHIEYLTEEEYNNTSDPRKVLPLPAGVPWGPNSKAASLEFTLRDKTLTIPLYNNIFPLEEVKRSDPENKLTFKYRNFSSSQCYFTSEQGLIVFVNLKDFGFSETYGARSAQEYFVRSNPTVLLRQVNPDKDIHIHLYTWNTFYDNETRVTTYNFTLDQKEEYSWVPHYTSSNVNADRKFIVGYYPTYGWINLPGYPEYNALYPQGYVVSFPTKGIPACIDEGTTVKVELYASHNANAGTFTTKLAEYTYSGIDRIHSPELIGDTFDPITYVYVVIPKLGIANKSSYYTVTSNPIAPYPFYSYAGKSCVKVTINDTNVNFETFLTSLNSEDGFTYDTKVAIIHNWWTRIRWTHNYDPVTDQDITEWYTGCAIVRTKNYAFSFDDSCTYTVSFYIGPVPTNLVYSGSLQTQFNEPHMSLGGSIYIDIHPENFLYRPENEGPRLQPENTGYVHPMSPYQEQPDWVAVHVTLFKTYAESPTPIEVRNYWDISTNDYFVFYLKPALEYIIYGYGVAWNPYRNVIYSSLYEEGDYLAYDVSVNQNLDNGTSYDIEFYNSFNVDTGVYTGLFSSIPPTAIVKKSSNQLTIRTAYPRTSNIINYASTVSEFVDRSSLPMWKYMKITEHLPVGTRVSGRMSTPAYKNMEPCHFWTYSANRFYYYDESNENTWSYWKVGEEPTGSHVILFNTAATGGIWTKTVAPLKNQSSSYVYIRDADPSHEGALSLPGLSGITAIVYCDAHPTYRETSIYGAEGVVYLPRNASNWHYYNWISHIWATYTPGQSVYLGSQLYLYEMLPETGWSRNTSVMSLLAINAVHEYGFGEFSMRVI